MGTMTPDFSHSLFAAKTFHIFHSLSLLGQREEVVNIY